ncbi:Crp/Fnr family transcriptional regulator [Pedobacter sp. V48]|uniref:Crp/Fnr family transcriptional regulator n=1 Tax=Pedobacter sp. V48 TaxID=509635 RepID=UPI0004B338C7|nr:cyclic nucleotide-binding domain-containing protein [Pedobacter sp. V48]
MQPISNASFITLAEIMERFLNLSVKFRLALRAVLFETTYKKGARILNAGSTQQSLWFLLHGLAREIRVHPDTFIENTAWFWLDHSFLYTTPGLFSREPSENTIELSEECKVILMSYDDLAKLKETHCETELIIERIRGAYDSIRQLAADDIRNLTTDERYLKHQKVLDNLFGRTQLRYIAGYMGMSPDTLGKLRKKYSKSGHPKKDPD